MTTMEDQLQCFYLDGSSQNASDMLRKCVQDKNSELDFNCKDDPMKQELFGEVKDTARMNNISIQRGITHNRLVEGFTGKVFITDEGPGKTSIPEGQCPEGYSRSQETGKCIQKCIGCIYRYNMKSQQFNEADPCFPEGTYNGITNEGNIRCTCGSNNQYCSNSFISDVSNFFTANGMMILGKKIIANTGETNSIDILFSFDQLLND